MNKKSSNLFDKTSFGKRLRSLREKIDLTQEEFASLIDRSRVAYNAMESGKVAPSINCLTLIVTALRKYKQSVSYDFLLGAIDHQNSDLVINANKSHIEKLEAELANCKKINSLQERIMNSEGK